MTFKSNFIIILTIFMAIILGLSLYTLLTIKFVEKFKLADTIKEKLIQSIENLLADNGKETVLKKKYFNKKSLENLKKLKIYPEKCGSLSKYKSDIKKLNSEYSEKLLKNIEYAKKNKIVDDITNSETISKNKMYICDCSYMANGKFDISQQNLKYVILHELGHVCCTHIDKNGKENCFGHPQLYWETFDNLLEWAYSQKIINKKIKNHKINLSTYCNGKY